MPGDVAAAGDAARPLLDAKHRARELTVQESRRAIRSCATAIRAVHRGEFDEARRLIDEAAALLSEIDSALGEQHDIRYAGFHTDAQKEFAEANLTLAFVAEQPLPDARSLGDDVAPYLNGMAEAASELRRQTLDCLRRGDVERAETLLGSMDEVYSMLVTIDYPDAITGGLRRTTDALRAVLERTRGDVTTAIVAARLQAAVRQAGA